MQTKQTRVHIPNHPVYLALTLQEATVLCPSHRGPGTRQLEIDTVCHRLLKFFKLANPKPAYPVLSNGNTVSVPAHASPLLPFLLSGPGASTCPPARCGTSALLGTVSNKWSLRWQLSPYPLAWPYLNNDETYMLNHLSILYPRIPISSPSFHSCFSELRKEALRAFNDWFLNPSSIALEITKCIFLSKSPFRSLSVGALLWFITS